MAKLTLNTIGSRYGSIDSLNDNFDAIEQALENTLSRDGTSPNAMEADLDLNSNDILNAGEVSTDSLRTNALRINGALVEPLTITSAGVAFQTYEFTATAGQTSFSVAPAIPYLLSIEVFVNGLQLTPTDIAISGSNVLVPPLTLGDEVVIRRFTAAPTIYPTAATQDFQQAGAGAQVRTVESKLRESVSVKDFGAVGDGVVDDTLAIQAAIDAVYLAGGGELYFPTGTYVVSSSINVWQRVVLVGDTPGFVNQYVSNFAAPKGSCLFLATGSNTNVLVFRCQLTNNAGILEETLIGGRNTDARHFGGARHMMIWGNRSLNQSPAITDLNSSGNGISIQGARYVYLQDCVTMFCADDGVEATSFNYGTGAISTNNLQLLNVTALSNGEKGFELSLGDSTFSNVVAGYNGTDGVQLVGSCTWTSGAAWNNGRHGIAFLSMPDTASAVITGVSAYDNDETGFRIGAGRAPALIGCIGRGNGRDVGATSTNRANFLVEAGAEGWSLSSCYSYAKDQDGVNITQYGFRITNTTYSGSIDGIQDQGAVISGVSISDHSKLISHGGVANAVQHPPLRLEELAATPSTPTGGASCCLYMKSNKLIFQYDDTGTTRYKYLDLTGTGVTWVHTTVAP